MSKSEKWKLKWSFYLDSDGRRKYNETCRRCSHNCKQSFRTILIDCPHYVSLRSEDEIYCRNKGRK
ncbi:MAG: hypothetical protein LIO49_07135 [Ruminococcus sp.]|nr:hypothetical protein [Ruminococcus sp.]